VKTLTFNMLLKEEFLVNIQSYPEEYHALFVRKYNRALKRYKAQKHFHAAEELEAENKWLRRALEEIISFDTNKLDSGSWKYTKSCILAKQVLGSEEK
jgi:hypothetical protein